MQSNPYQAPLPHQGPAPQPLNALPEGGVYEFDMVQNIKIAKCASRARTWGVISVILGILILLGLVALVALVPSTEAGGMKGVVLWGSMAPLVFVYLGAGVMYFSAGGALRQVVDTQGNDIGLLLSGLNKMSIAFMIEAVLTVLLVIAGIGALVLGSAQ